LGAQHEEDAEDRASHLLQDAERRLELRRGQVPFIASVAILVRDYDEARDYYVGKLGFRLVEDTPLTPEKRWVLVEPSDGGTRLLLAKAASARQAERVGDQTGGRVFLFLETDDFRRDHDRFRRRGVDFRESPREEKYSMVAVFADLYGNLWDLIERRRR
jgi:catechol 2,3-dioxygenase-like lactoylglutathione lyase family enzyme